MKKFYCGFLLSLGDSGTWQRRFGHMTLIDIDSQLLQAYTKEFIFGIGSGRWGQAVGLLSIVDGEQVFAGASQIIPLDIKDAGLFKVLLELGYFGLGSFVFWLTSLLWHIRRGKSGRLQ